VSRPASPAGSSVQLFGLKSSGPTRAAERFFKERRVGVIFVDLAQRPIARGELARFVQRFGLNALLDLQGKTYERLGLAYLRLSEDALTLRVIRHPELLRLPLVRAGKRLTVGEDPQGWAGLTVP